MALFKSPPHPGSSPPKLIPHRCRLSLSRCAGRSELVAPPGEFGTFDSVDFRSAKLP